MGRPHGTKYIKDPQHLLQLWNEYKEQVGHDEIEQSTAKGDIVTLRVKRPYLKQGFEEYCFLKLGFGIGQYLDNQDKAYNDYLDVVTCIRRSWETDQISGTMTGKYKAQTLAARLCNLTESIDHTTNGESINQPIQVTIVKGDGD